MIHAGRVNGIRADFLERLPVAQSDVGIEQRNFLRRGQRLFLLVGKFFADVWNHHVPAGEDRVLRLRGVDLAAAGVSDFHFLRAGGVAEMLHAHGGAVQANAHRRTGIVELRVIRFGENDICGRTAGNRIGNQFANQQARDGGVAVGKWKKYFSASSLGIASRFIPLPGVGIKFQSLEAGQVESPRILRGDRVDAHAEQSVRERLVDLDDIVVNAGDVFQIVGVADARELRFLLVRSQAREIVLRLSIQALQVALGLIGDGSIGKKLLQQAWAIPATRIFAFASAAWVEIHHQFVGAEGFLVEENLGTQAERAIEILVEIFRIRGNIDAQLLDHPLGDGAVGSGTLDRESAAKAEAESVVDAEFVALGVSAKVVVVVEDENAGLVAHRLAVVSERPQGR